MRGGGTALLIDAGLSLKDLRARMARAGLSTGSIDAVLVTHAHIDHVKGADVISRRLEIPVHANLSTADEAHRRHGVFLAALEPFVTGVTFTIGGLEVSSFRVPHDTDDPVGFVISDGASRVAIATDLGRVTGEVEEAFRGCDAVVLESNHDIEMLWNGPYHYNLKKRIAGDRGHLSNDEAAALIDRVYHDRLRHVVLAHVSDDNNRPHLPVQAVCETLGERLASVTVSRGWKRETGELIELQ